MLCYSGPGKGMQVGLTIPVNRRQPGRHRANTVGRDGKLRALKVTLEKNVSEARNAGPGPGYRNELRALGAAKTTRLQLLSSNAFLWLLGNLNISTNSSTCFYFKKIIKFFIVESICLLLPHWPLPAHSHPPAQALTPYCFVNWLCLYVYSVLIMPVRTRYHHMFYRKICIMQGFLKII